MIEYLDVTPNNIKASKDFMRCVTLGIEGLYDNPDACLSSVIQTYKSLTAGWQLVEKINERVTLPTSNVSL